MNFSVGCDIEEISRFSDKSNDESFLHKVYMQEEITYSLSKANPAQHLAARFCAKEAVIKALGSLGIDGIFHCDVVVVNTISGSPEVKLAEKIPPVAVKISLSHCKNYAMAQAIAMTPHSGGKKHMDIIKKTAEIISLVFKKTVSSDENISMDTDPEWTSLRHIELIVTIEEEFNISFRPEDIPLLTSQKKLVEKISSLVGE